MVTGQAITSGLPMLSGGRLQFSGFGIEFCRTAVSEREERFIFVVCIACVDVLQISGYRTIQALLPRRVTLENVSGCPLHKLLEFLETELPMYVFYGFECDAADFGTVTTRPRFGSIPLL